MGITEDVRNAIKADPRPKKELAELVGLQPESLSLFMNGHRGVSLSALDRIAEVLELEIVGRKRKRKK
jgi:transcriptional regulator with XRE-family HTH domain